MSTSSPSPSSPSPEPPGDHLWTVDEHLDDILRRVAPLEPIELSLADAQGCVLTEDVTVPVALPPFDNSSMDGYAVRVADVRDGSERAPAVLKVVGDVHAGRGDLPDVRPGEAVRIMTGAPMPPGADAVVPVEWTDAGTGEGPATAMRAHSADPSGSGGEVRVFRPVEGGAHVRARGSDVTPGELALAAGTLLGPPQIGLLAAIGLDRVRVRPRPRVVVIATGSELVPPGGELAPGQIYDSNSYALAAAARDAGALAYRVAAVPDDAEALRAVVDDQLVRADAIVTSGGVSVGAYDVVKEALGGEDGQDWRDGRDGMRGAVSFRRLAMQPGKPQGFGLIGPDGVPFFGLPGNPVSSYVSFELFVRPAIRALMGLSPVRRETVRARCRGEITGSPRGRRQFLRGRYENGEVTVVGGAGSHLVGALARANALIVVGEETTAVASGEEVDVVPLT